MEKIKIYASCEHCGLAWTQVKELPPVWGEINCPECGKKTENFDDENHNADTHEPIVFKEY